MRRLFSRVVLLGLALAAGADCISDSCLSVEHLQTRPDGAVPIDCHDAIRDDNETDVDCGGECAPCPTSKKCLGDGDCQSNLCEANRCSDRCTNGQRDGDESDVDCGGLCPPCADGKACRTGADCSDGNCQQLLCATPHPVKFAPAQTWSAIPVESLVAADLDGDGHPEIVAVDDTGFGVFKNATLAARIAVNSAKGPIAFGDFDGDGALDAAVALGNRVTLLRGSGDGAGFALQTSPSLVADALAAADFDGDGKIDLLAGDQVLLGHGDFTFAAPVGMPRLYSTVAVDDWNGDGKLDLTAAGTLVVDGEWFKVCRGDGTGALTEIWSENTLLSSPFVFALGNLVAGKGDAAALSTEGLSLFARHPDGTLGDGPAGPTSPTPDGPVALVAGDFDGDGRDDVVVASGDGLSLFRNGGGGALVKPLNFNLLPGFRALLALDADGDGRIDLLAGGDPGVLLFLNQSP